MNSATMQNMTIHRASIKRWFLNKLNSVTLQ